MEKILIPQLKENLKAAFKRTTTWVENQPIENFNKEITEGKWTIAQHVFHLTKSTKAVSKGMSMPKMVLRTMFGKNNREERTLDQLRNKYKGVLAQTGMKAPPEYSAKVDRQFELKPLIKRFNGELEDMLKALDKFDEAALTKHIMPHPAVGKLTIREFMYFTILHTDHHLELMKRLNLKK